MTGQTSTTTSSWTTWHASYQFTVLGEYPGTSATGSPTRSGEPSAASKMPCSSSNRSTLWSWPAIVTSAGSATDLLPASTMTLPLCRLMTVAWMVSECSKPGTILPWKLSMTTYEPCLQLAAGQVRVLMRLVVRPDGGRAHLLQFARHVVDVALGRVDVEHQCGGDQLMASLADVPSVLVPDAVVCLLQDPGWVRHRIPPKRARVVIGQRARGGCRSGMQLLRERPRGAVVRAWCPKRIQGGRSLE